MTNFLGGCQIHALSLVFPKGTAMFLPCLDLHKLCTYCPFHTWKFPFGHLISEIYATLPRPRPTVSDHISFSFALFQLCSMDTAVCCEIIGWLHWLPTFTEERNLPQQQEKVWKNTFPNNAFLCEIIISVSQVLVPENLSPWVLTCFWDTFAILM